MGSIAVWPFGRKSCTLGLIVNGFDGCVVNQVEILYIGVNG